MVISGNMPS
jgi:hypothetical protein